MTGFRSYRNEVLGHIYQIKNFNKSADKNNVDMGGVFEESGYDYLFKSFFFKSSIDLETV